MKTDTTTRNSSEAGRAIAEIDLPIAVAAVKAALDHYVPPGTIAIHLVPVAREVLEANRAALEQAERCLSALEQECELGDLDVPDSSLGRALHLLNEVLTQDGSDDKGTNLNIQDAVSGLLIALNGDPTDWKWNCHLATAVLAAKGSTLEAS